MYKTSGTVILKMLNIALKNTKQNNRNNILSTYTKTTCSYAHCVDIMTVTKCQPAEYMYI